MQVTDGVLTNEKILAIRKALGETQAQLAKRLHLGKGGHVTVHLWEKGKFSPAPRSMNDLRRLQRRLIHDRRLDRDGNLIEQS